MTRINICSIDHRCISNMIQIFRSRHKMSAYIPSSQKFFMHIAPMFRRHIISARDRSINFYAGSERSPTVVTRSTAPRYPGRSPFVIRNPIPSVIVIKIPSPIMERSPAPWIIRYPRPAVISERPISMALIWRKTGFGCRNPYISFLRKIYPMTIGTKLIVKNLKTYICTLSSGLFNWQRNTGKTEYKNKEGIFDYTFHIFIEIIKP